MAETCSSLNFGSIWEIVLLMIMFDVMKLSS